jgi:hypothetical protein
MQRRKLSVLAGNQSLAFQLVANHAVSLTIKFNEHLHFHDSVRLLLAASIILLCNHIHMVSNWCAPWKLTTDAENLVSQALQFKQMGVYREFTGEET